MRDGIDDFWRMQYVDHMDAETGQDFIKRAGSLNLDAWNLSIFESIWYDYGQVSTLQLLEKNAFGRYLDRFPNLARESSKKCFREGWIDYLSRSFVRSLRSEIELGGYHPARGLIGRETDSDDELCGLISFTPKGIELYLKFMRWHEVWGSQGHWAISTVDTATSDVYATSIEHCLEAISFESNPVPREEPVPIGRWCDRWWLRFESGFRMRCWLPDQTTS